MVQRVCNALQSISWAGPILGFSDREPIDSLSLYATREWFTNVQQSQMLDHLRTDVLHAGRALEDEICEIWMMEYIRAAWREREKYAESETLQEYPRAKAIGAALASGERNRLGMMANLQNLHWVSVVVNGKESRILYGDPFKDEPDSETKQALHWWAEFHTGRKFTWGDLDVPIQMDGFNCGILSHSSLVHHFLPNTPLITSNKNGPADARLEMMIRIVNRHLDVSV
ncbi:hypothetical protein B0H13DRAFT_1591184 [Mycena leptocephala]|nr:hypothetical protein B0H13DRAFT_1591184 [Mycena leptocephala]